MSGREGAQFITTESQMRGIDPKVALRVAASEGGIAAPGLHGSFPTGDSWYQFQLHWGGPEYPQFGVPGQSVAGMGNGFTDLTSWSPGDPAAWRDAARYALNRAKTDGWGAWYGAAACGITGYDGIDQSVAWDPNSQTWDYETKAEEPLPVYTWQEPAHLQETDADCCPESIEWCLYAYGRTPDDDWIEQSMLAAGVWTPAVGCTDRSGAGVATWLNVEYGEYGYVASNSVGVTFDDVAQEAATLKHPIAITGAAWYHWSAVANYDSASDCLILRNPAPGWQQVYQVMSREQWATLGDWNMVRLTHPAAEAEPVPEPEPIPPEPSSPPFTGDVGSGLLQYMAADGTTPAMSQSLWLPPGSNPAQVELCWGTNGVMYCWLLETNQGFRYGPT